jgi:hypothetical protein
MEKLGNRIDAATVARRIMKVAFIYTKGVMGMPTSSEYRLPIDKFPPDLKKELETNLNNFTNALAGVIAGMNQRPIEKEKVSQSWRQANKRMELVIGVLGNVQRVVKRLTYLDNGDIDKQTARLQEMQSDIVRMISSPLELRRF